MSAERDSSGSCSEGSEGDYALFRSSLAKAHEDLAKAYALIRDMVSHLQPPGYDCPGHQKARAEIADLRRRAGAIVENRKHEPKEGSWSLPCTLGLHSCDGWETFEKRFTAYLRSYPFGPVDWNHSITGVETWQRSRCVRCGRVLEERVS